MQVTPPQTRQDTPRESPLHAKAMELETAFLAEMLRHAGFGTPTGSFGGGIGAEQFASFLREGQAAAMARAGGIGLSESLFHALAEEEK